MTRPEKLKVGNRVKYVRRMLVPEIKYPPIGSIGRVVAIDYQPKYTDYKIEWEDDIKTCYCDRKELHKMPDKKGEIKMDLNQIDEKTEQRLMDISQEDDFEEHIAMLVRAIHNKKKEEDLSDDEAELLSYIVINKLSSEMTNYLAGFVEIEDQG